MASMATMDYYSIYGALLQTPVEGPGFADALNLDLSTQYYLWGLLSIEMTGVRLIFC